MQLWINSGDAFNWIKQFGAPKRKIFSLNDRIKKRRMHIHTGKCAMHLIKQQRFDDSHVHLCNIKICASDCSTNTTVHVCMPSPSCSAVSLPELLPGIITGRLGGKKRRESGEHSHITQHIQAFRDGFEVSAWYNKDSCISRQNRCCL